MVVEKVRLKDTPSLGPVNTRRQTLKDMWILVLISQRHGPRLSLTLLRGTPNTGLTKALRARLLLDALTPPKMQHCTPGLTATRAIPKCSQEPLSTKPTSGMVGGLTSTRLSPAPLEREAVAAVRQWSGLETRITLN